MTMETGMMSFYVANGVIMLFFAILFYLDLRNKKHSFQKRI